MRNARAITKLYLTCKVQKHIKSDSLYYGEGASAPCDPKYRSNFHIIRCATILNFIEKSVKAISKSENFQSLKIWKSGNQKILKFDNLENLKLWDFEKIRILRFWTKKIRNVELKKKRILKNPTSLNFL